MSTILDRTALGAFVFLMAVAMADVSVARAQSGSAPTIIPTSCGAGVLTECGTQNLYHCEWKIEFNVSSLPYGGGLSFVERCEKSGTRPIYKDRLGLPSNTGTCSVPKPLGPPGDVEVEVPFEGDGTCTE